MRRATGFTVVELLVGLAVIGVLFTLGFPVLLRTIHTAKISSAGYDCTMLLRRAKAEAIKKNSPVAVRYRSDWDVLRAWVDVHGATLNDPPDMVFLQNTTAAPTATDHEVGQCGLPEGVSWGGTPDDEPITNGFTTVGANTVAVLRPDGSIQNIGAFRFHDERGNYLAMEIAPVATARVTLLKWDEETTKWREQGEEGKKWVWY